MRSEYIRAEVGIKAEMLIACWDLARQEAAFPHLYSRLPFMHLAQRPSKAPLPRTPYLNSDSEVAVQKGRIGEKESQSQSSKHEAYKALVAPRFRRHGNLGNLGIKG